MSCPAHSRYFQWQKMKAYEITNILCTCSLDKQKASQKQEYVDNEHLVRFESDLTNDKV